MKSPIFIVGGEGFVGSHITAACLLGGHAVTTFGLPMPVDIRPAAARQAHRIHGSAEDLNSLQEGMRASAARVVIWAAGFNAEASGLMASGESDAARAIAVNVGAWANVLRAAAQCQISRVIACGSTVVYGDQAEYDEPVDESAAHLPRTVYGLTKSLAESTAAHFARTAGLDIVTLRLPLLFGPGRWYGGAASALARLMQAAVHGQSIALALPAEPFDLMYVKDAAAAVTSLLDKPAAAPVYHVNGFTTSYRQIVDLLSRLRPGFSASVTYTPSAWAYPLISTRLIEREHGFRPAYSLESALRQYLDDL